MQNFEVYDGSPNASTDNDQDEHADDLEDPDADADGDADVDADGDADEDGDRDNDDEDEDNDDDDDDQDQDESQDPFVDSHVVREGRPAIAAPESNVSSGSTSSQDSTAPGVHSQSGPTSHPTSTIQRPSPGRQSPMRPAFVVDVPSIRPEALSANAYDIVPTIAAPHSTSINAVTASPDLRWVFSGGTDGYIRKFNWVETANGKTLLTVAQRHPFVDSVTKAGVLMSYWENEEPATSKTSTSHGTDDGPFLSPVYSLAVQSEGLWLLSGLESGGINLQSVRHDEGKRIHCLQKHTSAVSVLNLARDEQSVLSGSWDKRVVDWDLNNGQVKRTYDGSAGQISAVEIRPTSNLPVPEVSGDLPQPSNTFSTTEKPRSNGIVSFADRGGSGPDGLGSLQERLSNGNADAPVSPTDSLFGGNDADSLFGDNDEGEGGAPSGGTFPDDDDDEFSRAIANGIQQQENEDAKGDLEMLDTSTTSAPTLTNGFLEDEARYASIDETAAAKGTFDGASDLGPLTNGLPHAEEAESSSEDHSQQKPVSSATWAQADSTFLTASFDGTLHVWDRRKPNPVAKVLPKNCPPWCMNACWSPDGNYIYAGRRNGTVEEFSLHKGLQGVERIFKFPNGSGPVSAVRAMPNGRHLICASYDILRLYDLQQQPLKHSTVPFLIVPGHRTGVISQLYIDPACRFMISTAGNRGWEGNSTEVLLGYEIGIGG